MLDITSSNSACGEKTAVALGLFDGVHVGHQEVILSAARQPFAPAVFTFKTNTVTTKGSGALDVILSSDLKSEFFEKMGIKYLYSPSFEKIKDMTALQFVLDILEEKLNAGAVVCGEDFRFGKGAHGNAAELKFLCAARGIDVIVISPQKIDGETVSSTIIRELIKNGDITRANRLLGYEFCLRLPVVKGNQIGRTLNFPTINQYFPREQAVPKFGVYASRTFISGREYLSITNIGVKPTVGGEKAPLAETNIFGFSGDLYGQTVKISLCRFVRPECKFSGLAELSAQMSADTDYVKNLFNLQAAGGDNSSGII